MLVAVHKARVRVPLGQQLVRVLARLREQVAEGLVLGLLVVVGLAPLRDLLAVEEDEVEERVCNVAERGTSNNTEGYSSADLAMGFANVRAGTWYPPEHSRIP